MTKKIRTPVSRDTAAQVLVASDSTCCKCEDRGQPIQIHHIDDDPANNDSSNLAVLCLRCHGETQIKGGFARHTSAAEIRLYRDNWVKRVKKRRRDADSLMIERRTGSKAPKRRLGMPEVAPPPVQLSQSGIEMYIDSLPEIFSNACGQAQSNWHNGSTLDIVRANYNLTEALRRMWLRLAAGFPDRHFEELSLEKYIQDYLDHRYRWHCALAEPHGYGRSGTIVGILLNPA